MGGRLYALAHGVRQKLAHFGVAAGAAVRGINGMEIDRSPVCDKLVINYSL